MRKLTAILILFATAFLVHEYVTGGTRQCVYEYAGSRYHITIPVGRLCPRTLEV